MSSLIGLSRLPHEIAEQTGGPTIKYRQAYNAAIDAQIPTVYIRGRHYVQRNDLPLIATHFGIALGRAAEANAA
jgi:hypothetical protein